jgi:2-polyprenyl-6-methoxyphenol hydroxylase-like FAD-dependent oxidoreductase
MVDTVALAQDLTTAASIEEALVRFDQHRRRAVRRVQNIAGMLQRLCGLEADAAVVMRDSLLVGLSRLPGVSENSIRRALAKDVTAVRSSSVLGNPS